MSADEERHYPSLEAFYADDECRLRSPEVDVGLWWREQADGILHRAAWVVDTGELYLMRLGPPEHGGGTVELLAVTSSREELDTALEGWREHCLDPDSLPWLRRRVRRLGEGIFAGRRRLVTRGGLIAGSVAATLIPGGCA